ncbi:MAG: DUF305 domain-containing protein [Gordonia sp. (in: high G+C Gram-positive bacteria)]|uniref:DUF305 domain-containing protein n=1 Tax=Gordonia sp. (in: high G+C Gram-positive bacteria) TaxID=84139 RepID=UPI0039E3D6B1
MSRRFTGRQLVTAAAALTVLVFAVIGGMMLRPALISDSGSSKPALNPVEIGFSQDMLAHHQQAIEMGRMIDRPGIDDRIRTLGRQIVQEQQYETGLMSGWLQLDGQPLSDDAPMEWMTKFAGTGQTHHGDGGDHAMPGMSTPDEVAALGSLPAQEAENNFLIQMQRHHYGGVAMCQDFLAQVPDGVVAQAASSMMSTQTKETGLIGVMLAERGIQQR